MWVQKPDDELFFGFDGGIAGLIKKCVAGKNSPVYI
jgi:hypothetical protein